MIPTGVLLVLIGAASLFLPLLDLRWLELSPLGGIVPFAGAALSAAGVALIIIGAVRKRPTKVFDAELEKMSDDEVLQTVKEIENIKEGNPDTFVGMLDEAPLAETKAELDELVDRYSAKMAVSRQTVMTVLKHSRKVGKLKG